MARQKVRILLADDHAAIRHGLADLFGKCPDIEIVGEAQDGQVAVSLTRSLLPDVVLMDVFMPVLNGIEATRILNSEMPQVRVIGLSMHEETEIRNQMLNAGAARYLCKTEPPEVLMEAVRACALTRKEH
jgi:DNA-binding NarL/FixJ family response regulator